MQQLELQVGEQVLQEKNSFLVQELEHRRQLISRLLTCVVIIIIIIAAAAVALVLLPQTNNTCVNWLQHVKVGKYMYLAR